MSGLIVTPKVHDNLTLALLVAVTLTVVVLPKGNLVFEACEESMSKPGGAMILNYTT